MKLNKTLAAVAMFVSTGAAQAGVYGATGDMFLNVIDTSNNSAYSLDLGISAASLLTALQSNSPYTVSVNDANFAALLCNTCGGDSREFQLEGQAAIGSNKGILATDSTNPAWPQTHPGVNTALATAFSNIGSEISAYQGANSGVATGMSIFETQLQNADFLSTNANSMPASTTSPVGTQIALLDAVATSSTTWALTNPANVNFNISNGVGTLTVTSNVAAVPLPAAVWMFMTGLIGVFSFNRRRAA